MYAKLYSRSHNHETVLTRHLVDFDAKSYSTRDLYKVDIPKVIPYIAQVLATSDSKVELDEKRHPVPKLTSSYYEEAMEALLGTPPNSSDEDEDLDKDDEEEDEEEGGNELAAAIKKANKEKTKTIDKGRRDNALSIMERQQILLANRKKLTDEVIAASPNFGQQHILAKSILQRRDEAERKSLERSNSEIGFDDEVIIKKTDLDKLIVNHKAMFKFLHLYLAFREDIHTTEPSLKSAIARIDFQLQSFNPLTNKVSSMAQDVISSNENNSTVDMTKNNSPVKTSILSKKVEIPQKILQTEEIGADMSGLGASRFATSSPIDLCDSLPPLDFQGVLNDSKIELDIGPTNSNLSELEMSRLATITTNNDSLTPVAQANSKPRKVIERKCKEESWEANGDESSDDHSSKEDIAKVLQEPQPKDERSKPKLPSSDMAKIGASQPSDSSTSVTQKVSTVPTSGKLGSSTSAKNDVDSDNEFEPNYFEEVDEKLYIGNGMYKSKDDWKALKNKKDSLFLNDTFSLMFTNKEIEGYVFKLDKKDKSKKLFPKKKIEKLLDCYKTYKLQKRNLNDKQMEKAIKQARVTLKYKRYEVAVRQKRPRENTDADETEETNRQKKARLE